jgi:hypothetical protein
MKNGKHTGYLKTGLKLAGCIAVAVLVFAFVFSGGTFFVQPTIFGDDKWQTSASWHMFQHDLTHTGAT